jgi:hypothetical protein
MNKELHQTLNRSATLDRPHKSDKATQHSSDPNLIRKLQDWQDWTYIA